MNRTDVLLLLVNASQLIQLAVDELMELEDREKEAKA